MPSLVFKAEIPLHEVAANTKEDIVESLRWIANKLEKQSDEQSFQPFKLDHNTVANLRYISYGVTTDGVSHTEMTTEVREFPIG